MPSPASSGAFPWRKCRSEPQIAASVTRTMASPGSSISGSGTSRTATRPTSSKTTALIAGRSSLRRLADEPSGHRHREAHELVGGLRVSNDLRQIALEAELALHHALDGIELPPQDLLPAGEGGPDDELRLRSPLGRHPASFAAPAVP